MDSQSNKGQSASKKLFFEAVLLSELASDKIWQLVQFWSIFNKDSIGINILNAFDKIEIELIKSSKSFPLKDIYKVKIMKKILEAHTWLDKAKRRKIINEDDYQDIYKNLNKISKIII